MPQASVNVTGTDLEVNATSFQRSLRAANKSDRTVESYLQAVALFTAFLEDRGMPQLVANIRREHVEMFIADLLERGQKPSTAANRYSGLRAFFKWCTEEGEVKPEVNPMAHTKPPRLPETMVPILTLEELEQLFKACKGQDFEARRDLAILRVMATCGLRRAEIAGLRYAPDDPERNDVDLDVGQARVRGKGGRDRLVGLDRRTVLALDRYLRVRDRRPAKDSEALWLSKQGALTPDGIRQMLQRRVKQAGIDKKVNPHMLRHTFAHHWLADGGQETDLMRLAGWRSRQMLSRYAASAAQERALAASKRVGIGQRI